MENSLNIIYVGSDIEASYVASQLNENGIDCYLRNRFHQSLMVGYVDGTPSASTEVSVYEEDTEKALKIIENYQHDKDQLSE